jgi:hypothetical protein
MPACRKTRWTDHAPAGLASVRIPRVLGNLPFISLPKGCVSVLELQLIGGLRYLCPRPTGQPTLLLGLPPTPLSRSNAWYPRLDLGPS